MDTVATPTLKSVDDAISARLSTRAEAERKRLAAEAEQKRIDELGKKPFFDMLVERIAADYRVDIRANVINIEYSHGHGDDACYSFALFVDADPAAAPGGLPVEVEAWISQKWATTASTIRRANPRDTVWIVRRRAFFDGPDDGPVTLFYEFGDFVDALVMAKTGESK